MGTTTELLTAFSTLIADAGLGITFSPTAVYTAGQTGIFWKLMPTSPDRVVTLTLVDQGDDVTMPSGSKMLQVRGRGLPNRPTDVDDLLDGIFAVLHGRTYIPAGAQSVTQCLRRVSVPMGMDEASKRWERVDQYYLDVDAPTTALRPAGGSW